MSSHLRRGDWEHGRQQGSCEALELAEKEDRGWRRLMVVPLGNLRLANNHQLVAMQLAFIRRECHGGSKFRAPSRMKVWAQMSQGRRNSKLSQRLLLLLQYREVIRIIKLHFCQLAQRATMLPIVRSSVRCNLGSTLTASLQVN